MTSIEHKTRFGGWTRRSWGQMRDKIERETTLYEIQAETPVRKIGGKMLDMLRAAQTFWMGESENACIDESS